MEVQAVLRILEDKDTPFPGVAGYRTAVTDAVTAISNAAVETGDVKSARDCLYVLSLLDVKCYTQRLKNAVCRLQLLAGCQDSSGFIPRTWDLVREFRQQAEERWLCDHCGSPR